MRGDSRRDLYAKGLALAGLGVLAGIGALVDYWPARQTLPAATAAFKIPEIATARAAVPVKAPQMRLASSAALDPLAGGQAAVPAAETAPPPVRTQPLPALALATTPATIEIGTGVALTAPPAPPASLPVAVAQADVPAAAIQLAAPTSPVASRYLAPPPIQAEANEDGFFAGATELAKKAGSTVLSTGSKAGASIMDGLGFVGRTFKKIRIFRQDNGFTKGPASRPIS